MSNPKSSVDLISLLLKSSYKLIFFCTQEEGRGAETALQGIVKGHDGFTAREYFSWTNGTVGLGRARCQRANWTWARRGFLLFSRPPEQGSSFCPLLAIFCKPSLALQSRKSQGGFFHVAVYTTIGRWMQ